VTWLRRAARRGKLLLDYDTIRRWGGRITTRLLALPRFHKRAVLVVVDFLILSAVLWGSISLRYGEPFVPPTWAAAGLLIAAPLITIAIFGWFGLYRLVTRYISYRGSIRIALCVGLSVLIWSLLVFMSGQLGVPRTVVVFYGIVSAALIAGSRQVAGIILRRAGVKLPVVRDDHERKPVLIYGAGQYGVQLLEALRRTGEREVVGFLDQEQSLWGQYVGGIKVYRPEKLARLIERAEVKEILLALPEGTRRQRRAIVSEVERFPVEVKILPAIEELASGRVATTDLRPVGPEDLLGRDPVPPNVSLLSRSIQAKSILVTGAGGSVGSELVRQIVRLGPRRLVLLDLSEAALYEIGMEIAETIAALKPDIARPELRTVLGSVLDAALVSDVIREGEIETIYHAAAYKHVPIVEDNPIVGLHNNTFGAAVIAECAKVLGVERFVLISTDKAVRPTNVMGASKRLSELILQAHSAEGCSTVFTMVRFGNVLDSSGSVLRRFRKQIKAGGPVTVTHPEVIRYFMSITEAAELVIQAGAMATGGELFVLDMGEPVKIDDLARLMVRLSGLDVRSDDNPDGDIAITYMGLRPGEKLFEELLIGENTTGTEHPRILRLDEPFLEMGELKRELDVLKAAMTARDSETIQAVLMRTVEGYRPDVEAAEKDGDDRSQWRSVPRTLH